MTLTPSSTPASCIAIALTVLTSAIASAHRGQKHPETPATSAAPGTARSGAAPSAADKSSPAAPAAAAAIDTQALAEVSESYDAKVAPIFESKCGDCHGSSTHYPWYYRLPGARQLIDRDVAEAKEHLDISHGFPFTGHGTPLEDIREISRITQDDSMPPVRYWLLHPGARLTPQEKSTISAWTSTAERQLTEKVRQ